MKCLSKKILCYILIGFLTFSVTSTVYYKSVHAMEWVGGALAFEEALKWLLAAIGITATAGMTDAYWDTYGDDFTEYAIDNGATQTEVVEWQLKACQGVIDKGSIVWDKFKAWASSLVNGSSSSVPVVGSYYQDVIAYLNDYFSLSLALNTTFNNTPIYGFRYRPTGHGYSSTIILWVNSTPTWRDSATLSNSTFILYSITNGSGTAYNNLSSGTSEVYNFDYLSSNIADTYNIGFSSVPFGTGTSVSDSNFEGIENVVQTDLDVISSDGVDENEDEVTVSMPGVSDSDNEASKDVYQDIIDAINDGTITQEKGIEQIQEILKVITYDTVTDNVVPPQQNDDGTDKTKDDALKENNENMGFTLGGLEAVFPFCIPFDIYAFMTLLVADPVCPEFDFPIKSVNGQVEEIHIDLEPFEPVAVVVRYCFDFLFIIGLAMLTRSLIGGGSSD